MTEELTGRPERTPPANPLLRVKAVAFAIGHVSYGSLADISQRIKDVRFTLESGHSIDSNPRL
jgi:hypothetical protein